MMAALTSSETSLLTRATWRNIPEDAILQPVLSYVKNAEYLDEVRHILATMSKSYISIGTDAEYARPPGMLTLETTKLSHCSLD
jgi:hypothetical protein